MKASKLTEAQKTFILSHENTLAYSQNSSAVVDS